MQITATNTTPHMKLIAGLYSAVDAMNATSIVSYVTEDVNFRLGNFDALVGRDPVKEANEAFFETISAMRHTITDILSEGETVFCTGSVHYTRKDQSGHEVPFATRLQLRDGKVADYQIYVDISGL
ncbi:nuclear transport factor 2 family protein [Parasedimentitalea psychrophila]|uniref:Nuclear transport factor 2 family protein n=1 Tax=Parasedimentitalea psychrophila TaxID=2997337 RepID=A0A9Y2P6R6_9RHOB|nr:nuclear transport factor 2 family protein [Parasedimentitalea psychrophila]WIY24990.1 nuclear transport factor 2 family protein [Parasedimentitalea psychrophila]